MWCCIIRYLLLRAESLKLSHVCDERVLHQASRVISDADIIMIGEIAYPDPPERDV